MSAVRRLLGALGAILLCGAAGAAAPELLEDCAAHAGAQARGIEALEAACPGVGNALLESGLIAGLPQGWRETLSPDALRDLGRLARRYTDAPARAAPDPGTMRAVLDQLASEQQQPKRSWWSILLEKLRSWIGQEDPQSSGWLQKVLERLVESLDLITVLTYVLVALLIVAAVWLVVNELRLAGVLSRSGGLEQAGDPDASLLAGAAQPDIADLDALALRDQPALLLRLLVARLMANGQLRAERNLTHRELVARNTIAVPEQRARFAQVTRLAERQVYGWGEPDAAQLGAVLADGRELLRQLQGPEVARP